MKRISLAFSIGLILAMTACGPAASQTAAPTLAVQPVSLSVPAADQQETLVALFQRVNPGVVAIKTVGALAGSLGSGFVYDSEGHIVTNYHVVEGSEQLEVDFTSGFKTYGTVVGTDLDSDLAVIKVDAPAEELHPLLLEIGRAHV